MQYKIIHTCNTLTRHYIKNSKEITYHKTDNTIIILTKIILTIQHVIIIKWLGSVHKVSGGEGWQIFNFRTQNFFNPPFRGTQIFSTLPTDATKTFLTLPLQYHP